MNNRPPSPPRHLTPEAKRFWKAVVSEYDMAPEALLILRSACEQWDRAQQAREQIARDGLIIDGRAHAAVAVEKQACSLFLRSVRALGLDVVQPSDHIGRPPG